MSKIKQGDRVLVLKGKDSGKQGLVLSIDSKKSKVIVEGLNIKKLHIKSKDDNEGGIKEVEKAFDLSNVAILDSEGCFTRIRYSIVDNVKRRISVKSNTEIK